MGERKRCTRNLTEVPSLPPLPVDAKTTLSDSDGEGLSCSNMNDDESPLLKADTPLCASCSAEEGPFTGPARCGVGNRPEEWRAKEAIGSFCQLPTGMLVPLGFSTLLVEAEVQKAEVSECAREPE